MTNMTRRDFLKLAGVAGLSTLLGGCNNNLTAEEEIKELLKAGKNRQDIFELYLISNGDIDNDVRDIIRLIYPFLENCDENYFAFALKQISLIKVKYSEIINRPNKFTRITYDFPCDITYYKNPNDIVNADYIFPEICSWLAINMAIKKEVQKIDNTYTKAEIAEVYLNENNFLTEEEKEMIKPVIDFLNDYTEEDSFASALATLRFGRIVYESAEMGNGQKGKCDSPYRIYCYESNENRRKYYIVREFFKAICYTGEEFLLNDGMSTLLAREYTGFRDTNTYGDKARIIRTLCEILPSKVVLDSYLNKDTSLLKNELLAINPEENKANEFLDTLSLELDSPETLEFAEDIHKKCNSYFIGYFNDKYGYNASEDVIMKDYLDLFKSKEQKYFISKTYFNDKEKDNDTINYENINDNVLTYESRPLDEVVSRNRENSKNFSK